MYICPFKVKLIETIPFKSLITNFVIIKAVVNDKIIAGNSNTPWGKTYNKNVNVGVKVPTKPMRIPLTKSEINEKIEKNIPPVTINKFAWILFKNIDSNVIPSIDMELTMFLIISIIIGLNKSEKTTPITIERINNNVEMIK